jgi:hypothetical protein
MKTTELKPNGCPVLYYWNSAIFTLKSQYNPWFCAMSITDGFFRIGIRNLSPKEVMLVFTNFVEQFFIFAR